MTEPGESVRDESDSGLVLAWLKAEVANQGTGRRPSKIQMAMGWYGDDEPRVGAAIRELIDRDLVTLEDVAGFPGMGPWVCPR